MKQNVLQFVGHNSQLFGIEQLRLADGSKGDGMRLVQIRNGKGLTATLSPDRCLDICRLEYKGVNLSYMSPTGYVAPNYYNSSEFMWNFTAGFLTTCGTENAGTAVEDDGELTETHGRISNVPAEQLCCATDYSGGEPAMKVSGEMNQGVMFHGKMVLSREVAMHTDKNLITITDTLTNIGGETRPCMMLYHMNMGYPMLDEGAEILLPTKEVRPRDARAAEGTEEYNQFPAPTAAFAEQVYYHTLASDPQGMSCAALYNKKIGKGVLIRFDTSTLNRFVQWKMPGVRDYVLGFEPSNCEVEGRKKMREEGKLQFIAPGESKRFHLEISILDGEEEAAQARSLVQSLLENC